MPGTYYLSIWAVQSPFEIGSDEQGRSRWSVNFECTARGPSDHFEKEMATLLVEAGLGVRTTPELLYPASNIFIGGSFSVPEPNFDNDVPIIQITSTGGSAPIQTHNRQTYERLTCQILVRAIDYDIARERIHQIWRALNGITNTTVVAA